MQAALSARYGAGRLLHRQPVLAARGTLEILDGLPDYARHGIFAAPRVFEALARLSNATAAVQPNAKPDIRGFAVKVLGVAGAAALGGTARSAGLPVRQSDELRRARQRRIRRRRRRLAARPAGGRARADPPQRPRRRPQAAEAPRRDGRPPVLRLRQRDLRHAVAVHGRALRRAGAPDPGQAGAGGRQGFRRRHPRPPRRRAARLRAGAAVLRRRGFDADRGSDGRLAGGSVPPARRRAADAQDGRTRRRRAAVRPLGRARRPPPARRDHARAQGGVFSQSKGARRAVECPAGRSRRRSRRALACGESWHYSLQIL